MYAFVWRVKAHNDTLNAHSMMALRSSDILMSEGAETFLPCLLLKLQEIKWRNDSVDPLQVRTKHPQPRRI